MAQLQTTVKICLLLFAVCSSGSALRLGDVRHEEEFKSVDGWMNGVSSSILNSLERQNFKCTGRPCFQVATSLQGASLELWILYDASGVHYNAVKAVRGRGTRRNLDFSTTSREKSRGFRPPTTKADKKLERRLRRCILGGLARRCNIPAQRRIRNAGRTYFKPRPRPPKRFSFADPKVLRCVTNVVRRCARREGFIRVTLTKLEGRRIARPPTSTETRRPTPVVESVVPTPAVQPTLPLCDRTETVIHTVIHPTPTCRTEPIVRG